MTSPEFEEWWGAGKYPVDRLKDAEALDVARMAWNAGRHAFGTERDLMLEDLRELLRAVGLFDGAQPKSPHEVMQAAIREVRRRLNHDLAFPEVAPATVHCSRCGLRLTSTPVAVGQMFTLDAHNCPDAP